MGRARARALASPLERCYGHADRGGVAGELYSLPGDGQTPDPGSARGKRVTLLYSSLNGPSKSPLPFRSARTIYLRGARTRRLFIAVN